MISGGGSARKASGTQPSGEKWLKLQHVRAKTNQRLAVSKKKRDVAVEQGVRWWHFSSLPHQQYGAPPVRRQHQEARMARRLRRRASDKITAQHPIRRVARAAHLRAHLFFFFFFSKNVGGRSRK